MIDKTFRQRVDELLQNRRQQLHIRYQQSDQENLILRNASWDGCNTISLEDLEVSVELSTISNVKCLELYSCRGNGTIYNMANIETLDLYDCTTIEMIFPRQDIHSSKT